MNTRLPRGSRLCRSWLLFALLLSFAGCDKPRVAARPCLVARDGRLFLGLRVLPADEEGEYLLYESATGDGANWNQQGRYQGKLVGLLARDGRLIQVFADGTVAVRRDGRNQVELYGRKDGRLRLVHALRIDNVPHALGRVGERTLRLYRVRGLEWEPVGPPLRCLGRPVMARLARLGGRPVACWRVRLGGVIQPGLCCARLDEDGWFSLPPPPGTASGPYAVATAPPSREGSGDTGALVLLRVQEGNTGAGNARLQALRFEQGAWRRVPGVLEPDEPPPAVTGLDLRFAGTRAVAVVTGTFGARVFVCERFPEGGWAEVARPLSSGLSGAYLWLALLMLLLCGSLLVLLKRRQAAGGRVITGVVFPTPAFPASPVDRAVAMFLDGLLVTPLPVAYLAAGGGVSASALLPAEQPYLYWIWLGGLSLYLAVAEGRWGTSVGKRLLGIEVRHADGGRPSPRQAVIRNLARAVDFWPVALGQVPVPYLVAMVCVLFSRRRQRLGDTLARTVVNVHVPLDQRAFVLASASPRRRELFARLDLPFEVCPAEVEERIDLGQDAEENALRLARQKAERVADRLSGPEIVVAADTLVELDGEVIGKPRDRADARRVLARLAGGLHRVVTGVAVIDRATGRMLSAVEVTEVEMRALTAAEIEAYVDSGEADGKAGAYAIQETGDRFVSSVRGSITNVIGLPLELLVRMLEDL